MAGGENEKLLLFPKKDWLGKNAGGSREGEKKFHLVKLLREMEGRESSGARNFLRRWVVEGTRFTDDESNRYDTEPVFLNFYGALESIPPVYVAWRFLAPLDC